MEQLNMELVKQVARLQEENEAIKELYLAEEQCREKLEAVKEVTYSTTEIAREHDLTAQQVNKILVAKGAIEQCEGNLGMSKGMYFVTPEFHWGNYQVVTDLGKPFTQNVRWTEDGKKFVEYLIGKD